MANPSSTLYYGLVWASITPALNQKSVENIKLIYCDLEKAGDLMPNDSSARAPWFVKLAGGTRFECQPLHSIIQNFKDSIENNSKTFMLFHQTLEQTLTQSLYNKDPMGMLQVRDYRSILDVFKSHFNPGAPFLQESDARVPVQHGLGLADRNQK